MVEFLIPAQIRLLPVAVPPHSRVYIPKSSAPGPVRQSPCYWPGSLDSLINRNWYTARHRIQEGGKTSNTFPCSLNEEVVGWSFKWSEDRGRSVGPARRSAYVACPPAWWCCVWGSCMVSCFCSWHLSKSGLQPFCIYLAVHKYRDCAHVQLFLVPYSFFVFYGWRRCLRCLSRCKPCCEGSQTPTYLIPFVENPLQSLLAWLSPASFQAPNVSFSRKQPGPSVLLLHSRRIY